MSKTLKFLMMGSAAILATTGPSYASANPQAEARTSNMNEQESTKLQQLFSDYWAFEMRENPFSATGSGEFSYNDKVPQVSPADYERRARLRIKYMAALDAIDTDKLKAENALSADLLRFILKHDIALDKHKGWRIPFLADGGFHSDVGYIVGTTPFRNAKDYEDYLNRLSAIPAYLDQNVENMKLGLADGFTQPREIMPLILPSFEAQVPANFEDHPLYAPFKKINGGISKDQANIIKKRGSDVIATKVIPAYHRVLKFMKQQYLPKAAPKVGASHLPGGTKYYEDLVRYYTTLDSATPQTIHDLGLSEVKRIRAEMDAVIKKTGFKGDFKAFQNFLRTDPQFYVKTPQELLNYAAWLSKDIDGRLPAYFGKLPRQPYSVEPVPAAIAENYTTGRYVGAPKGGTRGGQYWVNTYALDKRPLYQMTALTLHEAVPGHHLQGGLSLEIEGVPEFRTQFYPHAFGEGWGLYAEKLGVEMGVYKTDYDEFGRLSYEMWRACRLVIDTGLHSKGWTRKQAMDYLAGNTALSFHNVQTEVDRYIAWPGQALAYKIGELTIWKLRGKAEAALGEKFDIRKFHDAVLGSGGLPMELLTKKIDAFIEHEK